MKTIVNHMALTKARINLGQVVKRVHLNREFFILEKDGIPVAGLMHIDDIEDYLEMQDPEAKEQIRKSYEDYQHGKARNASDFVAELTASNRRRKSK